MFPLGRTQQLLTLSDCPRAVGAAILCGALSLSACAPSAPYEPSPEKVSGNFEASTTSPQDYSIQQFPQGFAMTTPGSTLPYDTFADIVTEGPHGTLTFARVTAKSPHTVSAAELKEKTGLDIDRSGKIKDFVCFTYTVNPLEDKAPHVRLRPVDREGKPTNEFLNGVEAVCGDNSGSTQHALSFRDPDFPAANPVGLAYTYSLEDIPNLNRGQRISWH